jgi:hypothetical protein
MWAMVAMPEIDEMFNGEPCPGSVIDRDDVDTFHPTPGSDQGYLHSQLLDFPGGELGSGEDEPVNPVPQEAIDCATFLLLVHVSDGDPARCTPPPRPGHRPP